MNLLRQFHSRGQVATENLFIYAIVVSAFLVGLVPVWESGILTPQAGERGYIGFSQIIPLDWAVTTDGKVFLTFKNEETAPLTINSDGVKVTLTEVECDMGSGSPVSIPPGETHTFELECHAPGERVEGVPVGLMAGVVENQNYDMDVNVVYDRDGSGDIRVSSGKIYGNSEVGGINIGSTTTTTLEATPLQCFEQECTGAGLMDEVNCGSIVYGSIFPGGCNYCPLDLDLFPDGVRRCWVNGKCGQPCVNDNDCGPTKWMNLCKKCIDSTCKEA